MRVVVVGTHPIQYQAPLFRKLARKLDLHVVFMTRLTPKAQAASGFGVEFEWDTPLLNGYAYSFANNVARNPSTDKASGIILRDHGSLLASLKPEVLMVLGWFPRGYWQMLSWARKHNIPMVCRGESNLVSGRSLPKRIVKQFYFRWLFRQFKTFACIGRHNRDFYRHYGVPESKLFDAPYSIDTEFFRREYREHRPSVRRPGRWRIGFAGKLIPKKRPADLFSAITQSQFKDRMKIVVIGDGPLRPTLERMAQQNAVRAEFRGFLNQSQVVEKGYADLDAIVLPSGENETWGLVINEAMTGGIPAIVSHLVGCAPDLIESGETGYEFEAGKTQELTASIDRLVSGLEGRHDFSAAVLRRIADYSMEQTAAGIESALRAALS
jgi:glycosyltransferase involved in cell wall biosynthesis